MTRRGPAWYPELEALRRHHLEALSASPDPWDSPGSPTYRCSEGGRQVPAVIQRSQRGPKPEARQLLLGSTPTLPALLRGLCCPRHCGQPQWGYWELAQGSGRPSACLSACQCPSLWFRWPGDPGSRRFLTQNLSLPDGAARALLPRWTCRGEAAREPQWGACVS